MHSPGPRRRAGMSATSSPDGSLIRTLDPVARSWSSRKVEGTPATHPRSATEPRHGSPVSRSPEPDSIGDGCLCRGQQVTHLHVGGLVEIPNRKRRRRERCGRRCPDHVLGDHGQITTGRLRSRAHGNDDLSWPQSTDRLDGGGACCRRSRVHRRPGSPSCPAALAAGCRRGTHPHDAATRAAPAPLLVATSAAVCSSSGRSSLTTIIPSLAMANAS